MEKQLKKLTINRAEWLCGGHPLKNRGRKSEVATFLCVKHEWKNFRCCLGFLGNACGLSDEDMMNEPMPSDLGTDIQKFPDVLFLAVPESFGRWLGRHYLWPSVLDDGPRLQEVLARLNDREDVEQSERERLIKQGFEYLGYDVEFVGEFPTNE